MIQATNIHKSFDELEVLKGVNLNVKAGEIVSIVGPSGAGKTTLLQILGTLDKPNQGMVKVDGQDIGKMNEQQQAVFRNRQIGFVFQFHQLLPEFTALENVMIPMTYAKIPKAQREQKALELLNLVGLGDRIHHKPTELSGGQQQRVSIARALSNDPAIILADEPTGALDSQTGLDVLKQLRKLNETGKTVVIITHDLDIADMTDRKIILKDGKVASDEKVKHPKKVSA